MHADLEDEGQTVIFIAPKIGTSAAGADGEKMLDIGQEVTLVDTVSFENLIAGQTYTLKGILMDRATGKALLVEEKEVTAETTFTPDAPSGTAQVTFTLNSSVLIGKSVVVFESLMLGGKEIADHTDLEDEGQTVTFQTPKIGTSAAGADGEKILDIGQEVKLVDTVSFENLTAGQTYTLKGILMDRATGKPILHNSKEVTAETTFMPEAAAGTTEVTFTLDSSGLIGKSVVVFESLEYGGRQIAAHADLEDEGQTVTFQTPKIGTSAKTENGGKSLPLAKKVTVIDTVAYENLAPGKEYLLKGTLMDKESEKPLMSGGKPITAETAFTPKASSGSAEVRFTFDARALAGRTLVVFESLELEGKAIAVHADITDEGQSVLVNTPEPTPVSSTTPPPAPAPETPAPGKAVPQTGDNYMVVLWLALAGISLPCLLVCTLKLHKKKRNIIVVFILSATLLAGSAILAFREMQQYSDGANAYATLREFVKPPLSGTETTSTPNAPETPQEAALDSAEQEAGEQTPASSLPTVDFTALQEINPDLCGWLISENTPIHYPIAQAADNNQYLNHLYDGSRGKAGTPFLDYENKTDFTSKNSIVYGHNLLDGSMFSSLRQYAGQNYYEAHPAMLLLTPENRYQVELFAAFVASPAEAGTELSPWQIQWEDDAAFGKWISAAQGRSLFEADVAVEPSDRVLTLSTCTPDGRDRFVVMGRLVPIGM